MSSRLLTHRRSIIITYQALLVLVASFLAFWFRFDGQIPERYWSLYLLTAPLQVTVRGAAFAAYRLYEGFWRYTSISDLGRVTIAVAFSTLALWVAYRGVLDLPDYPRSVLLLDPILLVGLMVGSRLAGRLVREFRRVPRERRLLIYGAGDAGEMIVRDMRNNPVYVHEPIGFVDDDPRKKGLHIHGLPIFGTIEALPEVIRKQHPDEILVAIPSAEPAIVRRIVRALESHKVPILTLPSVRDLLSGKVSLQQARALSYEDLLPRPPVELESARVRDLVQGRRVLVTGAGGSIGAELARQIAAHGPERLLILDVAESALYQLDHELRDGAPEPDRVVSIVADVRRGDSIRAILDRHRPAIVFHAAAYKHVPLMEEHPDEAIVTNVSGTRNLIEAAAANRVERFVLVSTDKAVNPSSVMGATKKIGELLACAGDAASATIFCAVRFGNVLGSNGSVIPLFLEQIKRGGPVTVTHPEITRYFMTIPEAVHLVLQAAQMARGGELFVLDMGEQIRILDLARSLIRLTGALPDEEIGIEFTGLRPGEKLTEELIGEDEVIEPSELPKISRVSSRSVVDADLLQEFVEDLHQAAEAGPREALRTQLFEGLRRVISSGAHQRTSVAAQE